MIFASEDIGNANPNALNLAVSTMNAANKIGYPEARIILAQCVVYLASSPKSNSSYKAINKTLEYIKNNRIEKANKILAKLFADLDEKSYVVAYVLAVSHEAKGELEKAQKLYKKDSYKR